MKTANWHIWTALALWGLACGCDSLDDDEGFGSDRFEANDVAMVFSPGSPTLTNLLDEIALPVSSDTITFSISRQPSQGSAQIIANHYLRYNPTEAGDEHFEDEAGYTLCVDNTCKDGRILFSHDPNRCTAMTTYDAVYVASNPGQSLIANTDVLKNDLGCPQDPINPGSLEIRSNLTHGNASIELGEIRVVFDQGFLGKDQLIYSITGIDETVRYGLVEFLVVNEEECNLLGFRSDTLVLFQSQFEETGYALVPLPLLVGGDTAGCPPLSEQMSINLLLNRDVSDYRYVPGEGVLIALRDNAPNVIFFDYYLCYPNSDLCYRGGLEVTIAGRQYVCEAVPNADNYQYSRSTMDSIIQADGQILLLVEDLARNDTLCGHTVTDFTWSYPVLPVYGELEDFGLELSYRPDSTLLPLGLDSFTYEICKDGACARALVTINVED